MSLSASTPDQIPAGEKKISRKALVAAVTGNFLEFFDFTVYALFAVMIGRVFFPVASASGQLMLTLATFGVGFLMRPLGGIIIGAYADRKGRKAALTLTMALMAVGTGILGLTPSYDQIGLLAPALVVLARLLQGFSAGGEMGAATTYLVEAAPAGRRGLFGAWQYASQGLATFVACVMGYTLASALSPEAMNSWGWRVPFLFGMLIGPLGFYIRRHMEETTDAHERHETSGAVLESLLRDHWKLILLGILSIMGGTISNYIVGKYMTTYAMHTLGLPAQTAMLIGAVSGAVVFGAALLGGWLSDRYGRRLIMVVPRIVFVLLTVPGFYVITTTSQAGTIFAIIAVLALFQAMSGAVGIIALPECFPRAVRTSGLSITYALGVTIFGGTAQLVVTWLLDVTGDPMALAWYLIATNAVTIVALWKLRPPAAKGNLQ
ncbi:MFS transporter [Falsirhodobacter sp. 20TX0035]|uniref:MFS transporter n=1 Tax=Falsirhodobacter sp. 20TX0035 TaxID=3022019 RepID=UPI00232DF270|nr:MFS transporter [Falsirhodobacter sp. 20TX0035]MDB6454058.1 MFS transporter [Falsirhodobacter sp. 20TX0035]